MPDAQMPSLSSGLPELTPSRRRSAMNATMPRVPCDRSCIAISTQTSACGPLVIQFLVPLMIQSSPSRTAMQVLAAASEPVPGSDRAKQPRSSPLASGVSQRTFWS